MFGASKRELSATSSSSDSNGLPTLRNLACCPRLGRATVLDVRTADEDAYAAGAVYVHVHARRAADTADSDALTIEGVSDNTDTHLAPGGRHGGLRLNMVPGRTYTSSVDVILEDRLTGPLATSRLSIAVGCVIDGTTRWAQVSSLRAPNEPGLYRLTTTFRVPEDASAAWVRLICGMAAGGGRVAWDRFQITETPKAVPYFDGDTPSDRWYEYSWAGKPDASPSVRTMRHPSESWPASDQPLDVILADILREIEERAGQLLVDEATVLMRHLELVRSGRHDDLSEAAKILVAEARKTVSALEAGSAHDELTKIRHRATNKIAALTASPHSAAVASIAGRRLMERNQWEAATGALRTAVQGGTDPLDRYRLAFTLERLRQQRSDQVNLVRSTAAGEVDPPFDVRKAAEIDVNRFAPRREVGAFLADHLSEIQARAAFTGKLFRGGLGEFPIFTYWGQGYHDAPPVVRACRRALEQHNPTGQLHFLDSTTLPYYAEFPDSLLRATRGQPALFSDALRVELLARYGGIWIDATCLTTAPLGPIAAQLVGSGFFAFNYVESRISSWLMVAKPGSRIVAMLRAALLTWFDKRQDLVDYYLIHHIFEMLYRLDPQFAAEWDSGVRRSSKPPHELQLVMYQEAQQARLEEILASSFVHKLTHKLNRQYRDGFISPDSYLAAVIRGATGTP